MRIPTAYISPLPGRMEQTGRTSVPQNEAGQPSRKQVSDSYRKNSQQGIIDAEYVEIYSPSQSTLAQERQTLDDSLEPEQAGGIQAESTAANPGSVFQKYQLRTYNPPPRGSMINIIA